MSAMFCYGWLPSCDAHVCILTRLCMLAALHIACLPPGLFHNINDQTMIRSELITGIREACIQTVRTSTNVPAVAHSVCCCPYCRAEHRRQDLTPRCTSWFDSTIKSLYNKAEPCCNQAHASIWSQLGICSVFSKGCRITAS